MKSDCLKIRGLEVSLFMLLLFIQKLRHMEAVQIKKEGILKMPSL